ncbi:iron ABC transporter permease [Francisella sp. LA112445]|jgi:iron complex transport system permease protein|uniref:FecCD family ABC transporter permease n=1 Tax=Francisella sp. LA112445 TaxID=1395624 RepID=UPI001788B389|nr:iron ABC transporter permease [Francisella sp. LA112445]QIW10979.1 iron ABC transporter permease [Francisella sp. LA112445]
MDSTQAFARKLFVTQRRKYQLWSIILIALLIVVCFLSIKLGALSFSLDSIFDKNNALVEQVVLQLRLPRLVASAVVGAGLAVSGVMMQGLFRNPLADPALLGMTSGASLFAIIFLLVTENVIQTSFVATWGMGISAFVGSLVITLMTYLLSVTKGRSNLGILVLAGVAINALCGALIGVMTYLSDDGILRNITFWSMGSFANISWGQVVFLLASVFVAILFMRNISKYLNAMISGEEYARMLGINIQQYKFKSIVIIALLVGASTAVAGPIAFIGLVVPHIMRFLIGNEHKYLMFFSAIFGALLLTVADVLSRMILSPAELPIGLMTALIGAPYFVYLLFSKKVQNGGN